MQSKNFQYTKLHTNINQETYKSMAHHENNVHRLHVKLPVLALKNDHIQLLLLLCSLPSFQ